jgi:hypothetical protein
VADNEPIRLSDNQRLDWLRLIRSENVGPRGIMEQLPERQIDSEISHRGGVSRDGD